MAKKIPFAVWRENYLTGVDFVDSQHLRLVQIMNELYDGLTDRYLNRTEVFRKAALEAVEYVKKHFAEEEVWMAKVKFPHLERQRKEHRSFVSRLLADTEAFSDDNDESAFHFVYFLRDWLLSHIAVEDKEFRFHLSSGAK